MSDDVPDASKPSARHIRYVKMRMCSTKQAFRTREQAKKIADKFGQSVYECPICFCWHCTNRSNWRNEFVRKDHMDRRLRQQEATIRGELNREIRKLRLQIDDLNARLAAHTPADIHSNASPDFRQPE